MRVLRIFCLKNVCGRKSEVHYIRRKSCFYIDNIIDTLNTCIKTLAKCRNISFSNVSNCAV